MSKCKPGDLAIVLAGINEGKIVTVMTRPSLIRKTDAGKFHWDHPVRVNEMSVTSTSDAWVVEGNLVTHHMVTDRLIPVSAGVIPDMYLKPISGPGISDDEYSEIELKNQQKLRHERLADKIIKHGLMYGIGPSKVMTLTEKVEKMRRELGL